MFQERFHTNLEILPMKIFKISFERSEKAKLHKVVLTEQS